MRCGFRPHNRDRTTESMEGVWMGFGPIWRGVGLQKERGFPGYSVNRWRIKRPPNGTKLEVLYQGHLARLGSFRECSTPTHEERREGDAG